MTKDAFCALLLASALASGCQFQHKTDALMPTAPTAATTGDGGAASSSSESASSPTSGSTFEGTWNSPTLPGLPKIASCTDLHWTIASQTANAISGTVSATCGGVADITANLTGDMNSSGIVNLAATGSAIGFGLTCGFDLTGVGHRESDDAWRLDYQGRTCFGNVSGSELLRRNSSASAPQPQPEPDPSPAPSPAPAPTPAPTTGSVACAGSTGKLIVECVEKAYPSRLAAGVSLQTRTANMQFLRDRIIETSKCKGLDVGLNLKRGGPSISTDFLVWRHDGLTEGVDIGAGYDDTSKRLNLIWHTYGPPNYGHPYYKDYGSIRCN